MKDIPESVLNSLQENEFLRSQLAVTLADYRAAVERLVSFAYGDTGAASAAAQVLLSLYNGRNYQLDISELGNLDYKNTNAALIAIRGWLFTHEYPHKVIENGQEIFDELEQEWKNMHVINRYRKHYEE